VNVPPDGDFHPAVWAPSQAHERENWFAAAGQNLARAYGPTEPEYRPEQIVEANPGYEA
jgi:hypothetical protein